MCKPECVLAVIQHESIIKNLNSMWKRGVPASVESISVTCYSTDEEIRRRIPGAPEAVIKAKNKVTEQAFEIYRAMIVYVAINTAYISEEYATKEVLVKILPSETCRTTLSLFVSSVCRAWPEVDYRNWLD